MCKNIKLLTSKPTPGLMFGMSILTGEEENKTMRKEYCEKNIYSSQEGNEMANHQGLATFRQSC